MAYGITDQDMQDAIERGLRMRAETAGELGHALRNGLSRLTLRAARNLSGAFSPSKPQH
ncbi:MAG: hypothetical protein AAF198_07490 [Pseudomonadota bacterium]